MSGVNRRSVDLLKRWSDGLAVPAVMLFGVINPADKNSEGSAAWREDGPVPSAIEAIRSVRPELVVITDLCLCGYTDHGHCGVLTERGEVDNDETLQLLARMGSVHAAAGADMVAPSAMMDGQVRAIREALDDAGFQDTGIMSYAAKFASSFYGPFRDAARSAPGFGDRRSYQLPPANGDEALRDAELDEAEGADWLMVKPALPYLDVLAGLREITRLPIAAYQVSGEYAMIKAAAEKGAIDEREVVLESLLSMKRAGANAIITYFAESVARWVMRHEA
jgi:porphobilinogen synthase